MFLFNDKATTEIYTLSRHDAIPTDELLHRLRALAGDTQVRVLY